MEITTELLLTLYHRANQYAFTKHGRKEPDTLNLLNDGTIEANYYTYHSGDRDTETFYISAENLTQDLDEVAAQRLKHEAEERIRLAAIREEERLKREERDKVERRKQYNILKKEFEP